MAPRGSRHRKLQKIVNIPPTLETLTKTRLRTHRALQETLTRLAETTTKIGWKTLVLAQVPLPVVRNPPRLTIKKTPCGSRGIYRRLLLGTSINTPRRRLTVDRGRTWEVAEEVVPVERPLRWRRSRRTENTRRKKLPRRKTLGNDKNPAQRLPRADTPLGTIGTCRRTKGPPAPHRT